jgi:hypothetical protein
MIHQQIKYYLLVVCISCMHMLAFAQVEGVSPRLNDMAQLQKIKRAIKLKENNLYPAYQLLIEEAEKALKFGPVSVMEKQYLPPSGNKHDYMSLAPYHWPDPSKKDGLPYIRKDGETNPEVKLYKDKEYLPKLCDHVFNLSLAYYYSDNITYSNHALKLVRVWFLDTATRMNPNMNFSQAIKGVNTGRGAGLIDARNLLKVIEAIALLNKSGIVTEKDLLMLRAWFTDFLQWMQTSPTGIDELNAPNNHGVWYDALRLSIALFIGEKKLANEIVLNAQKRLDQQMNASGRFPLEMERTTSLHYSVFAIEAFLKIAKMAESTNHDLWNYQSKKGNSLEKALNEMLPYLMQEKQWDGPQIKPFEFGEGIPLLGIATTKYGCKKCKEGIFKIGSTDKEYFRNYLLTTNDL